jgi:hypothetical protein
MFTAITVTQLPKIHVTVVDFIYSYYSLLIFLVVCIIIIIIITISAVVILSCPYSNTAANIFTTLYFYYHYHLPSLSCISFLLLLVVSYTTISIRLLFNDDIDVISVRSILNIYYPSCFFSLSLFPLD